MTRNARSPSGVLARRRRLAWSSLVVAVIAAAAIALGMAGTAATGVGGGGRPLDPSRFATGACEAFAPTHGHRGETVFLDAGHGGIDPGGVGVTERGSTIFEADETLPVELDTMALLRAHGFRVVVSRTGNTTVLRLGPADASNGALTLVGLHDDIAARDECANLARAKLLVGIYFDASSAPLTAGSLTAYDAARPFAAANVSFAELLQRDVLAAMNGRGWQIPDDGVDLDAGLGSSAGNPADGGLAAEAASYDHLLLLGPADPGYFSTPSEMAGAVVEPLYLTDPFEGSIASSAVGQHTIARGIARAVEQFLGSPDAGR